LNLGLKPPAKTEDREHTLQDRIDHAKTSAERDQLYLQMAVTLAQDGNMRGRDIVDKIEDSDTRQQSKAFVDATLATICVSKKETDKALELVRIGALTHLHKVWTLTQVAKLASKTDHDKALGLLDEAATEASRIDTSDPDRPSAMMAVADIAYPIDRKRGWEQMSDAIKSANASPDYTGEDGRLRFSVITKGNTWSRSSSVSEFNLAPAFTALAKEDYSRAADLARGLERDATRANAVIAIARAMLDDKNN
jgi:hypothetical protein